MDSDFESSLAASVSAANAKVEEREKAERTQQQIERAAAQVIVEKAAAIKARAERFKNNFLEPLMRKAQTLLAKQGLIFSGNYVDKPNEIGSLLETGSAFVLATIAFSNETMTSNVVASAPIAGQCFRTIEGFDEQKAKQWYEQKLSEAFAKLIETGEVQKSNLVTYNNRVLG